MTEAEWLACTDPMPMLNFLWVRTFDRTFDRDPYLILATARGRVKAWFQSLANKQKPVSSQRSKRKALLVACACCRRICSQLTDNSTRRGLEIAEQYADNLATRKEVRAAAAAICNDTRHIVHPPPPYARRSKWFIFGDLASEAVYCLALHDDHGFWEKSILGSIGHASNGVAQATIHRTLGGDDSDRSDLADQIGQTAKDAESLAQCSLIRDIYGPLPFRCMEIGSVSGTATSLAQGIYEERAFDRMPILGDALEEAGCTNPEILNHCRQSGEHARGCWVIDLLLDKR